jgi:hypothetical protein
MANHNVDRAVGGGGMSRVYVAMETGIRRRAAIKVLSPELTAGWSPGRAPGLRLRRLGRAISDAHDPAA